MRNHAQTMVAAMSGCLALLTMACSSKSGTEGTGGGGESTRRETSGLTGQGPQGGTSGISSSARLTSSSSGGNGSGGKGETGGRASGGSASTVSSSTSIAGGTTSGGGQGPQGGSARAGTTAGRTATTATSGSAGNGGRKETGGYVTSAGGASATGGSAGSARDAGFTGGKDGGGAQPDGAVSGGSYVGHEGFYKELFVDFGVGLDHLPGVPAADGLGWEWEWVATDDASVQHSYMWGNANDDNGVLLYPDREPRFMLMYTGGGYGDHQSAVGATGIKNVQDFFNNGGSYVGTCNGNYMAWDWAYKIWPGQIQMDGYEGRVEGIIPENSPLLRYFNFGGDHLISDPDPCLDNDIGLMHYKGGFETGTLPVGTEVLLIGKSHTTKIDGDGHPTGYAYKPKATSGRICGMNDHPEYALKTGEVMNYLQASFLYARDGVAGPDVKAALANGQERVMDKSSKDNDPAHAKIGDKQYHHFTVVLPNGTKDLTVSLNGDAGYDMNLYLAKDTFALASRAQHAETSKGPTKTLSVSSPEPGTWYVGVECATTVTATKASAGHTYSGNLAVLNGVKYAIKATWAE